MTLNERAETAAKLKNEGKCNCCQAVAYVLADETGVTSEVMMKLASGFALGIGNMENTCGALIGAVMTAGMKCQGQGTVRITRQINELFSKMCGSVICKELKGRTSGKVLCPCDECVRNAVIAYGKIVGLE